jgi:hypothetical protein
MLKPFSILASALVLLSLSSHARAKCVQINETVILQGVATLSAAYVNPVDFGWAPWDGFVSYPILVVDSPACLDDGSEVIDGIRVLQLTGVRLPSKEELKKGVPMKVKGTLFPEHTAHHFQPLVIDATEVTVANKLARDQF